MPMYLQPVDDRRKVVAVYPFSKMPETDELRLGIPNYWKVENMSSVSPACRKRRRNWAVSRNNRIRLAPVSVLGRACSRTLRNVYAVWSPTVGPTSSSVRLHIYVPSHIMIYD